MSDHWSRRDWLKTVGAAGAGALVPLDRVAAELAAPHAIAAHPQIATGDIVELYSTSEIFIPPRGRSFMKFSFDFPEPSVAFGDYRFGFLVFTDENTYGLDRAAHDARRATATRSSLTCDGFVWAGGQEKAPGKLTRDVHDARHDASSGTSSSRWTARSRRSRRSSATCRAARSRSAAARSPIRGDGDVLARLHLRRRRSARRRAPTQHDDARRRRAGGRERLPATSRRSTTACARSASTSRPGETATASRRSTSTTAGARTRASPCPRWRLGRAADARRGDAAAHGARRARVRARRRGRRAPTCPRGCATSRWSRRCTACTTPATSSTTTRSSSRSFAGWRRRSRPTACSCSSPRGTAATTGTIRTTTVPARMGGEAGFRTLVTEGAEARLQDDADVRHELGEPEAAGVGQDRGRRHVQDRRRRLQPQLGRLEQRSPPGRLARLHEPRRRLVAQAPRGPHRRT